MHDHDHSHGHHHHHEATAADLHNKAFIIGIALNGTYVIAQAIAGFMTNSVALLSDAGHNLSDVAGLVLSLIALKLASKKTNQSFTYGYKKTTILAALGNAMILLVAIGMLGYESITRLWHPEAVKGDIVAWVAGLGIVINTATAFLFFKNKDKELNAKGAYLHMLTDALVSLGVVVAGIIMHFTGWTWIDPVVSITILIVILIGTWSLLTDSLRMSIDAVPNDVELNKIIGIIKKIKGVKDLHHIHIWAMSTTENALTTHVVIDENFTFKEKMNVVQNIKHELLHNNIQHATIELESDNAPCPDAIC